MSENKTPRLVKATGKRVGEKFIFSGGTFGPYSISENGELVAAGDLDDESTALLKIINEWLRFTEYKPGPV